MTDKEPWKDKRKRKIIIRSVKLETQATDRLFWMAIVLGLLKEKKK